MAIVPYTVGGTFHANIPINQTTGGVLNGNATSPVTTVQVGIASVLIEGCNNMSINYQFTAGENAGLSGSLGTFRIPGAPPGCN